MIYKNWNKCIISENDTVASAIKNLSSNGLQICLVVNGKKRLVGTVTDGDLRNHILDKKNLNVKIKLLMNNKPHFVKENSSDKKIFEIMKNKNILQIPVVNSKGFIIDLEFWNKIANEKDVITNKIIFMAGGKGLRMRPLTKNTPKPMIKINNRPLLEKLILDANKQGFKNFILSINYLGSKIQNHFKNGEKFNSSIEYVKEKVPLGTAGSLGNVSVNKISDTFLVVNSDILTNIDYRKLISFHEKNKSDLTMVVKPIFTKHSFSVVKSRGIHLESVLEKPTTEVNYGVGIYVLNKKILKRLKKINF